MPCSRVPPELVLISAALCPGLNSELRGAVPVRLGALRGTRTLHHLRPGCVFCRMQERGEQEIPILLLYQRAPVLPWQNGITVFPPRARCRKSAECCYWSCPGSPVKSTGRCSQTFQKTALILFHLLPSQSSRGSGVKSAPSHGTSSAAQSWPDGTSAKCIRYRR